MQTAELGVEGDKDVNLPDQIPFLAPGQEWRTFWDSGGSRKNSSLPDSHTAIVSYLDSRGRQHQTSAILDFAAEKTRMWVDVKSVHDVAMSLKEIERVARSFTEGPAGGVQVYVRSGGQKDQRLAEGR